MQIKIIVPIHNGRFNAMVKQAVEPVLTPDVSIDVENITEGTESIQNRYDNMVNALQVAKLAKKTEAEGFDGVFVSDMDYCGVEAAREIVNIPVIGGFRASAYTAMMLAPRFSIITILESVADMQRAHTHTFGFANALASVRSVDIPVLSLDHKEPSVEKVFAESLKAVEEDAARAIILGCTGFIGVAQQVQKRLEEAGKKIPVIDPNCAAISYLILLIRNNLLQSRMAYHFRPLTETEKRPWENAGQEHEKAIRSSTVFL